MERSQEWRAKGHGLIIDSQSCCLLPWNWVIQPTHSQKAFRGVRWHGAYYPILADSERTCFRTVPGLNLPPPPGSVFTQFSLYTSFLLCFSLSFCSVITVGKEKIPFSCEHYLFVREAERQRDRHRAASHWLHICNAVERSRQEMGAVPQRLQ